MTQNTAIFQGSLAIFFPKGIKEAVYMGCCLLYLLCFTLTVAKTSCSRAIGSQMRLPYASGVFAPVLTAVRL